LRSDDTPTYNFTVVVDDATMGIPHVIRGDDHLNNTPRQIHIYEALGYGVPRFAHVPMILGHDRKRLSKRHGAQSVHAYREMGYRPEALFNYLVRLGWSYGDQEVFTKEELVEKFSLDNVGRSPAVFNPEKLLWLNALYIKELPAEGLCERFLSYMKDKGIYIEDDTRIPMIVETLRERSRTLEEMLAGASFYFVEDVEYDEKAAEKFLKPPMDDFLLRLAEDLEALDAFDQVSLEGLIRGIAEEMGWSLKRVAQPIRVAITGKKVSPGLFETMEALGRDAVVKRLKKSVEYIRNRSHEG
jgi:glutamyl-tRNA synthetase